jgi:translation initiation factor 3 subunit G
MTLVHPSVLQRRQWTKFGDSASLPPGPDPNTTSYAESVYLKLSFGLVDSVEEEPSQKPTSIGILCRICKGKHFSAKCPYKDTYQPLDVIQSTIEQVKESTTHATATTAQGDGKYVPPSLRNRGPGESMPRREELPTIRITNLSEDATEADVRSLVSRFGPTSRVFVARDKDLNICKGFAFVTYQSRDCAQKAINALNGFGYDSLILRVEWSNKD